jgi:uncharacterized membrane protein HdeD (DUF308 family)
MLTWGVLTLILGCAVLVWPRPSVTVASMMLGAYLVVSGIAQMVLAFTSDASTDARPLIFIVGALSLGLGVLAFAHLSRGYAVLLLAIFLGVGLFLQGVAEEVSAILDLELPDRSWHIFVGVVTAIGGLVMLAWPFKSITAFAVVAGIYLVLVGITQIVSAFRLRKSATQSITST